jgi:hypothetical protein
MHFDLLLIWTCSHNNKIRLCLVQLRVTVISLNPNMAQYQTVKVAEVGCDFCNQAGSDIHTALFLSRI